MPVDREAAARAIDAFLRAIGRDPAVEPALVGTGARVAEAFAAELCSGYAVDTGALVRAGAIDAAPGLVVVVRHVPVATTCPHHLLVAVGTATVAFQSSARAIGVGTVAALVDAHARRLALQEDITEGVVKDLAEGLAPAWVACRLVLAHGCMIARGERAHGATVETIALRGTVDLAAAHAVLR